MNRVAKEAKSYESKSQDANAKNITLEELRPNGSEPVEIALATALHVSCELASRIFCGVPECVLVEHVDARAGDSSI